jgi:Ca2+/H+ antiporter, TMEM165/GDT1 family
MNPEKVIFAFTIILAMTVNFGFFVGDMHLASDHHVYVLYVAIFVNVVATILKFGDRSHIGSVLLASSLVADIHLVAAAVVWGVANHITEIGLTPTVLASIVSLSGGALVANFVSVTLLVIETVSLRR